MKMTLRLLGFLFFINGFIAFGQAEKDSILLLNGRVYKGTITSVDDQLLKFTEIDKKGNSFTSEIATYRIFSYTQNGQDNTLYKQDEFKDNFLTVDEAKNATLGSYDARQTFKPRFVFWSSFILGYSASLFDTYLPQSAIDNPNYIGSETSPGLFKKSPTIFPFLVPALLTVSWSLPSFRIKEHQMIQKHLLNNESYYRGYHRISKQKRMLSALKGSLIGIGAGMVTYAVFKP